MYLCKHKVFLVFWCSNQFFAEHWFMHEVFAIVLVISVIRQVMIGRYPSKSLLDKGAMFPVEILIDNRSIGQ